MHLPTAALPAVAARAADPAALTAHGVAIDGDTAALGRLLATLDVPDPDFAIVTPHDHWQNRIRRRDTLTVRSS